MPLLVGLIYLAIFIFRQFQTDNSRQIFAHQNLLSLIQFNLYLTKQIIDTVITKIQKNLLIDEDSESNDSFDSSQICSSISRTASILSHGTLQATQQKFLTPKSKTRSIDSNQSQRTQSIQKPRIQIHSEKPFFQQQPDFQLGFFMGKRKQNVRLNQSKIKKGINFFDEEQTTFNSNPFLNNSMFEFSSSRNNNQDKEEMSQLSIPCFRNIGKNKNIQIDPNLLQKGKNFFDDDFEDTIFPNFQKQTISEQNQLLSFRKPTKIKKTFTTSVTQQQNFVKTINVNKKQKKLQIQKIEKKQVFDWNKFQISSKKLFFKQSSFKMSSVKKSTKSISKSSKKKMFQSVSFEDLQFERYGNQQKLLEFSQKVNIFPVTKFFHNKNECKILKCILCDLKIQEIQLNLDKLQNIFSQKLILQKLDNTKFTQLYEQICFKLLKYETFFPQIQNKHLNPSNILVEMHKKSKLIQSGNHHLGWIDFCVNQNKFYHSFIAEVREIYHSQKINTYFLLLADGWSNIWAVVTEKNYLYTFVHKLNLFSKLFIGYWKNYSLANILTFCPKAKQGEKCIEIWYNSSIIVGHNMKLGKPKSLIFYRPLNLIRKQGGIIPTVEGIVIRMFCPYTPRPKSYSTSLQHNTFNENYVQIITPERITVFIKFVLPTQRSLAELFRLYYKYHFYFLKIGQKDNFLQFNDDMSKFFEFEKKDKNTYQPQLLSTLRKRYINAMNAKSLNELKIGNLYDLKIQGKQGIINGFNFIIQNGNEPQNTNSFFKGSVSLYQQYELQHIQKSKSIKDGNEKVEYYLKKTKFSNILKSLPTIYEKLHQMS